MKNKFLFCLPLIIVFAQTTCKNNLSKEEKLKKTPQVLMQYLYKGDTSKIHSLIADQYIWQQKYDGIDADCKEIQKIINKYGFPSLENVHIVKGSTQENIFSILLSDNVDSVLGFRKAVLLVVFPPDQFLSQANGIYSYAIKIIPLEGDNQKIKLPAIEKIRQ